MKTALILTTVISVLLTTGIFVLYPKFAAKAAVKPANPLTKPSAFLKEQKEEDSAIFESCKTAWPIWKSQNSKVYASEAEESMRFTNFFKNAKKIFNHEKQYPQATYKLGFNQFMDLTSEEFKAQYLTLQKDSTFSGLKTTPLPIDNLPKAKDWEVIGGVTPIKNQGQCGSCWSFSTTGALEALKFQKTGTLSSFSEQQIMDCSKDLGNQSCSGGYMDRAYQYVASNGIMTEDNYPYEAADRSTCDFSSDKVDFQISGYNGVPVNDSDQLKAAVNENPVSVAISGDEIQFYSGGIWNFWPCLTETDHGVLAVGYGEENGTKFVRIKNSWGEAWGEEGYIRFARKEGEDGKNKGMCGINTEPYYPVA